MIIRIENIFATPKPSCNGKSAYGNSFQARPDSRYLGKSKAKQWHATIQSPICPLVEVQKRTKTRKPESLNFFEP